MMFRMIFKNVLLISMTLLAGCATTKMQKQDMVRPSIPLKAILEQFPAENKVQNRLLLDALLNYGSAGVVSLCEQLMAENAETRVAAEFALTGLSYHVIKGKNKQEYIYGLHQALSGRLNDRQKAYIISLLQNCAGDESVPVIGRYIQNEALCDPAARALATIGTDMAGKSLLRALAESDGKIGIAVIQALGDMRYNAAGPSLMIHAKDENKKIRDSALKALARIGYLPAESLLREPGGENFAGADRFAAFARTVAIKGPSERGLSLCREILNDENVDIQHRIAALTTIVDVIGEQGAEQAFPFMTDDNPKMRAAARRLVAGIPGPEVTGKMLATLNSAKPETKAEIIETLAERGDKSTLPAIREHLTHDSERVRLAAVHAVRIMLEQNALPDLITALISADSENEFKVIQRCLLSMTDATRAREELDNLPSNGRIAVIELLRIKGDTLSVPMLMEQLEASDEPVRVAALRALGDLAGQNSVLRLLAHILRSESDNENRAARNAIISIARRTGDARGVVQQTESFFAEQPPKEKDAMFKILGGIGGEPAFAIVKDASAEKELEDTAIRTMIGWPDAAAMDYLIQLIGDEAADETHRILAVRGALGIIRGNKWDDVRALDLYSQLLAATEGADEKRMILSGLAKLKSPTALKLVAPYTQDPELDFDAAFAAVQIASHDERTEKPLRADEVALALISAYSSPELQQKIIDTPILEKQLNRPPEGFVALFNGKDLTGWKGLVLSPPKRAQMSEGELARAQAEADRNMHEHWQVIDGILYFNGKGHSLCTAEDYSDCELWVDWKIERHGDSGIYLRGSPQVQIWDPEQWPEGSGALYNNKIHANKPVKVADNPVGAWNTFRIIMRGEKVTIYLNDALVVDNVIMENYWERDKPIYACGQIELQAHNTPLYFRNIFIRELPEEEHAFEGALFNGADLTGWQVIGNKPDSWKVEDGILYTEGRGGGWICTTREFSDFQLELEFRLPPGGNSGVFIRAPHEGNPAYEGMEIQVLDDYAEEYAKLKSWQYTGSIYDVKAPSVRATKQAGAWQKMMIICKGPQVKVFVNDRQIIDTNLIDHMDRIDTHPGLKRRKGYIGLQNHSTRIEYRNINIKPL